MLRRLVHWLSSLRENVSPRARLVVAVLALSLTLATWGPLIAIAIGLPIPPWEHLVYVASGPFCHQLPERSFHLLGHVFPLCTRCTGMWLGITLGVAFAMWYGPRPRWLKGFILSALFFVLTAIEWRHEQRTGVSWNTGRALLGFPIFAGFTLAVSYDVLALLIGLWRTISKTANKSPNDSPP